MTVQPAAVPVPTSTTMLVLEDVNTYYGNIHALRGISLKVEQGEIVTLIGANGAGKTTTLKTISGLLHPRQGRLIFEGQDVSRTAAHALVRAGIGQAPEGRRIFSRMTVLDNLMMGAFTRPPADAGPDIERVFVLFPRLRERAGQLGGTLSGGEQQMLAIGRALLRNPDLLLLDEPSEGLAPKLVEQVGDALVGLRSTGLALLLVEQNLALATRIGERLYVMNKGRVVWQGTPLELAAQPEVEAQYLGV